MSLEVALLCSQAFVEAGPSSEALPVFCHGHCSGGRAIFTKRRGDPVILTDTITMGSEYTHLPLCFNHYIWAIFVKLCTLTPLLVQR